MSWTFTGPDIVYECDEIKVAIDHLFKAAHRLTHLDREELIKAAIWHLERYLEEKVARDKYGKDGEEGYEEGDEGSRNDGGGRGEGDGIRPEVSIQREIKVEDLFEEEEEVSINPDVGGVKVTFSAFLKGIRIEDIG